MSDINNTSTLQPIGTPEPLVPHDTDPLDIILERLDATEVKIRQFLSNLETERNEIRQQCGKVRARATANKACLAVNPSMAEVQVVIGTKKRKDREGESDDGHPKKRNAKQIRNDSPLTDNATLPPAIPGSSSSSCTSEDRKLAAGRIVQGGGPLGLIPASQSRITAAPQVQDPNNPEPEAGKLPVPFQTSTRASTDRSASPEPIDISTYPPELKYEGWNWWILFNPSPAVKRVLDLILVHRLVDEDTVCCVKFSQDGKWFATASSGTVRIYNMKTGFRTCVLPHPQSEDREYLILCICFSRDGKYIASGAVDGCIRVWNIAEKRICTTLEAHEGEIDTIHYLSNGFLISARSTGDVLIWNIRKRTSRPITENYTRGWAERVAVSQDDKYVAVGGSSAVTILEVATGAVVEKLKVHSHVYCVAFTPDGKGLMAGYSDGELNYWDISGFRIGSGAGRPVTWTSSLTKLTNEKDCAVSIVVSPDGKWVASRSHNQNVLLWNAKTGVDQCLLHHDDLVSEVAFSPTGNFLATACEDGVVRIWHVKDDYRA